MPPKVKITKEDIIKAALELVTEKGAEQINARAIAGAIGCSTQPIFSNFSSMESLEDAVRRAAYDAYLEFIKKEIESGKYPEYKAMGMAYIRFARERRELFKLLFMRDRGGKTDEVSPDFEKSVEIIMQTYGITKEKATLMHLEMWSCVHGIATMSVTAFLPLDWELIGYMLTDVFCGIRKNRIEEMEDGRN